jgi:hypothetical protein
MNGHAVYPGASEEKGAISLDSYLAQLSPRSAKKTSDLIAYRLGRLQYTPQGTDRPMPQEGSSSSPHKEQNGRAVRFHASSFTRIELDQVGSVEARATPRSPASDAVKAAPSGHAHEGGAVMLELQAEAVNAAIPGNNGAVGFGSHGDVTSERASHGVSVAEGKDGSGMAASVRPGTVSQPGSPSNFRVEQDNGLAYHRPSSSHVRCGCVATPPRVWPGSIACHQTP